MLAFFGIAFDRKRDASVFDIQQGGGTVKVQGVPLIQLACLVFNNEKPEKILATKHLWEDTG